MTTSSSVKSLLADDLSLGALSLPIDQLRSRIIADLTALPHLAGIRGYNDSNLAALTGQLTAPPQEARILDVGASIHGFALNRADELGYGEYIGIDLDIMRHWGTNLLRVTNGDRNHLLCQMDAHRLWFADESMDAVLCLSGFEHYLFPELVLREMLRVLKPGGTALINYEPIWTCSYGHHLHHFGLGYAQVPPWSHLILTKTQMAELLDRKEWPAGCSISRSQAVEWIYEGRELNRRDFRFHNSLLSTLSCTQTLWRLPHPDPSEQATAAVEYAASLLPYSRDELLTRGFSCCFRK